MMPGWCIQLKQRPVRRPSDRAGFALVVTLSLMILLVIIAVGLLTLSSVSIRASSEALLIQEAKQNARLALILAIGELQAGTGMDQRVTAAAGIQGEAVAQPNLTGVWKGWKWDGQGSAPDFTERKKSDFLRWLVSSPSHQDVENPDFAKSAASGRRTPLVRGGSDPRDLVEARLVPVATQGAARSAAYAWAVFDESTKLPIDLPGKNAGTPLEVLNSMTAAALPGYGVSPERSWTRLADIGRDRVKLVSPGGASLAGLAASDRRFHDLTADSAGLLVNVAEGGFATDLSRLFDREQLPSDYATRHLYSGNNAPLAGVPTRFNGANPFPHPDPFWTILHSHYRLHRNITGGRNPGINATTSARPAAGSAGRTVRDSPYFQSQQLAPVIAKAQFVFSIGFQFNAQSLGLSARPNNSSLPPSQQDLWITWLITDPVITLWNPYNVVLRLPSARVDLYRVPMAFRIYKNGTLINSEYTHFANTFWDYHFGGRGHYYRANLRPPQGQTEIVMAPGEHLVFSAYDSIGHAGGGGAAISTSGVNLRPGFTPPAGNSSQSGVGGITTLNVCVAADGKDGGFDYGRKVRTVAVKAGDLIELDVKPQVLDIARSTETGGRDIAGFLKYYVGNPDSPTLVGGIEIDYDRRLERFLPSLSRRDLPAIRVRSEIPQGPSAMNPAPMLAFKEPFLITTFQLKTERDSKFPSRGWLHNSPTNLYASAGIDQRESWNAQQYELHWEAMTDWPPASPTIEISNTGNRGYGGPGIYAQSGVEFATFSSIPVAPALSLAQLRHAPLNTGGQLPLTSQVVANSFASPMIPADLLQTTSDSRTFLDHSYLANNALFDRTFFSGIATPGGPHAAGQPTLDSAITGFFDQQLPLANPRLTSYRGSRATAEIASLVTAADGHSKSAAHLLIDSPFNVNSTRVDVWEAILGSTFGQNVQILSGNSLTQSAGEGTAASRHAPSTGVAFETAENPQARDLAKWNGHRRLESPQIRRLAEEIVKEIKKRGPFQSLAEFVNRRPQAGEFGLSGTLQAAIDRSGINDKLLDPAGRIGPETLQLDPSLSVGIANPAAFAGNTADGAPGVLNQADLLTPIAPILTARGDTFRIRAYGEAGPTNGPKARAWCEAVVQRYPEYIKPAADEAWALPSDPVNQRFGRRYEIISFRWLAEEEI
jgi:type II secretory pathway pseudopilin PulG